MKEENKITHIWTNICSLSSIDANRNTVSLFNIIEEIKVDSSALRKDKNNDTVIPIPFEIISLWKRNVLGVLNAEVELDLIDPQGKVMMNVKYSLQIPEDKVRMRQILQIDGIKITSSGEYLFKVRIRESGKSKMNEVSVLPVEIKIKN